MADTPTIVFPAPGNVTIEDRPRPVPRPGEVLIKTHRTLVSTGTELTVLSGDFPSDSEWADYGTFPFEPGYNNVGVVVEVGDDVAPEWVGRRVASYGTHAAYVAAATQSVHMVPDELTDDQATFFTIGEIVMNGIRRSKVTLGETAVVYGLGLLGQLTVQLSALCGARPVIGVDVAPLRLDALPAAANVVAVDGGLRDVAAEVNRLTRGRMADVVFEVTGDPEAIPQEFTVLRPQGRFVVLSSPRGPALLDLHDLCNAPSYTIIGAHNSSHPEVATPDNPWTKQRNVELFFDLVVAGDVDVDSLISHTAPLAQGPDLYRMLLESRGEALGVILAWT